MTRGRESWRRERRGGVVVCAATAAVLALSPMTMPAQAAPDHLRRATLSGEGFSGGDPNATGRAELRIRPALERVCFHITFKKLVHPNFGAIHSGPKSASYGPLEVTLFNGDKGMRKSPIDGCARDVDSDVLRRIKRHPRRFWVQLDQHTYANSMVRGRIKRG